MQFDDKAKKAIDTVQKGYDKAEAEVDGFFVRNKYTVLILTGVATALVLLALL
jgi:hypothetical protein